MKKEWKSDLHSKVALVSLSSVFSTTILFPSVIRAMHTFSFTSTSHYLIKIKHTHNLRDQWYLLTLESLLQWSKAKEWNTCVEIQYSNKKSAIMKECLFSSSGGEAISKSHTPPNSSAYRITQLSGRKFPTTPTFTYAGLSEMARQNKHGIVIKKMSTCQLYTWVLT